MATGGRNAGFQERDALQLYDEDLALVTLQQSQPDPELMLGADYSELGPNGSIACYAVSAYRANQAKDLGLALSRAIQNALVAKKDQHVLPNTSAPASPISWEAWSVKQELDDLGYGKRELVLAVHSGPGLPTNMGYQPTLS
jgi:hypothetical protein